MTATTLRRLIVIALIALWEFLPRSGLIPELFLPALSSTLAAGWNEAGEYGHALAVTRRVQSVHERVFRVGVEAGWALAFRRTFQNLPISTIPTPVHCIRV